MISKLAQAVVAVEEITEIAVEAETLLTRQNVDNAIVISAPLAEGSARHCPYDVIIVEGGVEYVPDAIAGQLKDGGRIFGLFGANESSGGAWEGRLENKFTGETNLMQARLSCPVSDANDHSRRSGRRDKRLPRFSEMGFHLTATKGLKR